MRRRQDVSAIWNFLPRAQQGTFAISGLLLYADIVLVDAEGDVYQKRPHLYVEFSTATGPYAGFIESLSVKSEEIELDDSWRRIDFFPKNYPAATIKPRIHKTEKIYLDSEALKAFLNHTPRLDTLYAADNRFDFLRQRDIIAVANSAGKPSELEHLLEVRHIQKGSFIDYLNDHRGNYRVRQDAMRQIGREIADEEHLTILEVETTWLRSDE